MKTTRPQEAFKHLPRLSLILCIALLTAAVIPSSTLQVPYETKTRAELLNEFALVTGPKAIPIC